MQTTSGHPPALRLTIQALVAFACLYLAFKDLNWQKLLDAISEYGPAHMLAIVAYVVAVTIPQGLRLRLLARRAVSLGTGVAATFFGLAINMLLPAKLGEVAKTVYLSRKGATLAQATGMVFWERFLDVNMLLVCAFVVTLAFDLHLALAPLALFASMLWAFALLSIASPGLLAGLVQRLPVTRVRRFLLETLEHIGNAKAVRGQLMVLTGMTLFIWASAAGLSFLVCNWLAGFGLAPAQVLAVFVASAVGIAVPATPAGLGIFEIAVSKTLEGFGIAPESAMAATVALHLLQVLPQLAVGLLVLAFTGYGRDAQADQPRTNGE